MIMEKKSVLVTGGGGFLGRALCLALKDRGYEVFAVSRKRYISLVDAGIQSVACDLSGDTAAIWPILQRVEAVFHVAAKVDMWGDYESFYATNVRGTQHLLDACRISGVKKFIYTSSPSVIASGSNLRGVNESIEYPGQYDAFYPQTKAEAEKRVLAAHNPEGLLTLSLRPHLIWGPGDTNLVPTILERAERKRLVRIGPGNNLVDTTYIADCVQAHLCAFDALGKVEAAGGRAFFISQGEPVSLWKWIDDILLLNGYPPVKRNLPHRLAKIIASACEFLATIKKSGEPLLTRFLVDEMATDHYFDISAARELLGYRPSYSIHDAMMQTFGSTENPDLNQAVGS